MSIILPNGDTLRRDYRVIYADPAWTFVTRSGKGKGRSPEQHYDCMTIDEIKALPVAAHAADNAALLLWTTDPHLLLALEVMEAWGFEYKTVGFTWVKLNKCFAPAVTGADRDGQLRYSTDPEFAVSDFFTGMGYYTRANPEMCLLGTRGRAQRVHKDVRQLIISKRREHSRKPDEAYDRIERLFAGPYLEMFARTCRPGWGAWGNEMHKFRAPWAADSQVYPCA